MRIIDEETGEIIDEWISGTEPHRLDGVLEPGIWYIFEEVQPVDGYAYAEDIRFRISEDGTVDLVEMRDRPTHVIFSKQDIAGTRELSGGHYSIVDADGTVVYEYISDGNPHDVTGILIAGKSYYFVEDLSPIGYAYAEAVAFTVSIDGTIDLVTMKDKPTRVEIRKESETGELLGGAVLALYDETGVLVETMMTAADRVCQLVAKLEAGKSYTLHEVIAPAGYATAEDITFTVSRDGIVDEIKMIDLRVKGNDNPNNSNDDGPNPPSSPAEVPKDQVIIGFITAEYSPDAAGGNDIITGKIPLWRLVATGDEAKTGRLFLLAVSCLAGMGILVFSKSRKKKRKDS